MSSVDSPAPANNPRAFTDSKPKIAICNRCIPRLNESLMVNPCDGQFGLFSKKCARCTRSRHACVAVEKPLYPHLNTAVRAREAYARGMNRALDEDEQQELRQAALDAGDALTAALKTFDRNRSKVVGDQVTPRKVRAGAAPAASSGQDTLELQGIRRGVLGLVEVGKLLLRSNGVDTASVDKILGPDAPGSPVSSEAGGSASGDDDEEEEDMDEEE